MEIAVWRYGASFKTDATSTVGGGRISRRVVEMLRELGHTPVVVEDEFDPDFFDAVMILTGPFNAMYGALYDTYRRLTRYSGPVYYCWWDTALPFHFAPERVGLFKKQCDVTMDDLARDKQWTLLTQLRELPAKAPPSVARGEFEAAHKQCFWELAELEGSPMPVVHEPEPRMAYFGSPRSGRIAELKRWLGQPDSPPVDIFGKWTEKVPRPGVCA